MTWHCIPSISSPGQEGEFSQMPYLGTLQSALLKSKTIPAEFCCSDNLTVFYQSFQFGTMLKPSGPITPIVLDSSPEQRRYPGNSSFVAGSPDPAKTFPQPEKVLESLENEAAFGLNLPGSLARYDRDSSSWKTPQCSLIEGWDGFSETWPRWGSMRNGVCWGLPTPERSTPVIGFGFLPTPLKSDGDGGTRRLNRKKTFYNLREWWAEQGHGKSRPSRRPQFWEWMMGWPLDWTKSKSESSAVAMDKFQQWQHSHGESLRSA